MGKKDKDEGAMSRIAIVNNDKCKPKKCAQECRKNCPVVRMGKVCIDVKPTSTSALISEELCIGCGICVKKCPFAAIQIINLPKNLESQTTHRYGSNAFKLHRLPTPRPGNVLGLVGTNGIGKSTALKILSGKEKPNLGRFRAPPDWTEVLAFFRGSELQNYFTRILEDDIKALVKPQYVDAIPDALPKGSTVAKVLKARDERECVRAVATDLDLLELKDRKVSDLSGGELQRFAIALTNVQSADVYMYDEPSSYLDISQRLRAAEVIRAMVTDEKYVICVEHDLSVLDYLSDYVCVLYGVPGAYGVVTMPFSVREGINIFLGGFVPTENLRFRETELSFKISVNTEDEEAMGRKALRYPEMCKTFEAKPSDSGAPAGDQGFRLKVEAGEFQTSEILVLLGENGTGKTTFIRMLAGMTEADGGVAMPRLSVSYKPQKIAPKYDGSVRSLLLSKIQTAFVHPQFNTDVMKPLLIEEILDQNVTHLSGGELQRLAITLALGKPANVYLLDEPSAYLDSEQRVIAAKVIKRYILHSKTTAFVVEHDFTMSVYLADRVIVYTGSPGKDCCANAPQPLVTGMNAFLMNLGVTFRRDPTNYRPRINKKGSVRDQEQKRAGCYFFMDTDEKTEAEE